MATPTETVREFVKVFIAAWPMADATSLSVFFSEEAAYRNGPLEPVRGGSAIVATLAQIMTIGGEVDVDIVQLVANGPIVMTLRVDYWRSGDGSASLRVAGVFEVRDEEIVPWRDYFDGAEFSSQLPGTG